MTNKFMRNPLVAAVFAASSTLAASATAAPVAWNGATSNDWMEASNWNGNQLPTGDVAVQISNGDTVTLNSNESANTQHLYLGLEGDGHLVSSGGDLKADTITLAHTESVAGDINASLVVNNADINAPQGIYLLKGTRSGNKNVSITHTGGTLNTSRIKHKADINSNESSAIKSQFILRDVVVNTSENENILSGDIDIEYDADNGHATAEATIGLYDVTWTSNPKLDLEIGSDIGTAPGTTNSSLSSTTTMTVERSLISGAWMEFAEYTSTRDDSTSTNNNITNKVDATFIDSDIDLDSRMILGDVGARGAASNTVSGEVNVALINSTLDVRLEVQLTDIDVDDGATGSDRAYLSATNSEINIGRLLEIASYGSSDGAGTTVLDAGVTLENSQLTVNGIIQVADIAREVERGSIVPGPTDTFSGSLIAKSSTIKAQQIVAGSSASKATVKLDNTFVSLADALNPEDPGDIHTLDANEGTLTLTRGNTLVVKADGYTRADNFNAKGGAELYSAIDAIQVTLAGKLEINFNESMGDEGSMDLIRAAKDSIDLGENAFTGIKGDFDSVTFNGLPKNAKATTSIEQETIDGTTYDIYRVTVAGSSSIFALGFMLLLAGTRRSRK